MKVTKLIGSAFAGALLLAATPVLAQAHDAGGMKGHDMKGHDMKGKDMKGGAMMSDADKTEMSRCTAMSHADAAKDAKCAAMMKAHPDMMHHMPHKTM